MNAVGWFLAGFASNILCQLVALLLLCQANRTEDTE